MYQRYLVCKRGLTIGKYVFILHYTKSSIPSSLLAHSLEAIMSFPVKHK